MVKYNYTIFVGSSYWKSYTKKAEAQKESVRLRKDGAKRVRIQRQIND